METELRPLRVAVVDDEEVYRDIFSRYLPARPGVQMVGCYGSLAEALQGLRETPADVVLVDYHLSRDPLVLGTDFIAQARRDFPDQRYILFTGDDSPEAADAALQAGAHGVVHKKHFLSTLWRALHKVSHGHHFVEPEVASQVSMTS
jgi:DNA-binding NarL/FixJ family response regulator